MSKKRSLQRRFVFPSIYDDEDDDDEDDNDIEGDTHSTYSDNITTMKRKRLDQYQDHQQPQPPLQQPTNTNIQNFTMAKNNDNDYDDESADTAELIRSLQQPKQLLLPSFPRHLPPTFIQTTTSTITTIPTNTTPLLPTIQQNNKEKEDEVGNHEEEAKKPHTLLDLKQPQQNNQSDSIKMTRKESTNGTTAINNRRYNRDSRSSSSSSSSIDTAELLRQIRKSTEREIQLPDSINIATAETTNYSLNVNNNKGNSACPTDPIHTDPYEEDEFVLPDQSDTSSEEDEAPQCINIDDEDNDEHENKSDCIIQMNNDVAIADIRAINAPTMVAAKDRNVNHDTSNLTNVIVRQGLSSVRKQRFSPVGCCNEDSNSNYISTIPLRQQTSPASIINTMKENIENFSDDEYTYEKNQYGSIATTLLLQRDEQKQQQKSYPDNRSSIQNSKNSTKNHTAKSQSNNATIPNMFRNIVSKSDSRNNNDKSTLIGQHQISLQPKQQVQSTRRRIRDPYNTLSYQAPTRLATSSSATSNPSILLHNSTNHFLSLDNNNTISMLKTAGTATHNIAPNHRNDVMGGSGVGVNSYQILSKKDNFNVNDDDDEDEDASTQDVPEAATKKRQRRRPQSSNGKKSTKSRSNGGSTARDGGKVSRFRRKGKWSYINNNKRKKKQGGGGSSANSSTTTTNSRTANQRNNNNFNNSRTRNTKSSSSAMSRYNTDDPQLRHIGGAEMSF